MKPLVLLLLVMSAAACSAQVPAPETPAGPARLLDSTIRINSQGVLVTSNGADWVPLIGAGYPTRVLGDGSGPQPRPLSSFSDETPEMWFLTTAFEGYQSIDHGKSWSKVLDRDQLHTGANLTALSSSPLQSLDWAAGTTFHGLWISRDGGKTWQDQPDLEQAYDYADGSQETVNALAWSAGTPGRLYASVGKEGGRIWTWDASTGKKQSFLFPGGSYLNTPQALRSAMIDGQEVLEVRTKAAWWRWNLTTGEWSQLGTRNDLETWDEGKARRMEASKDKLGFYLSAYTASLPGQLEKHLDEMAKMGLNALVLDFKTDQGELAYASKVPLALAAKAVKPLFDAEKVIRLVHQRGFYLIARQVVFKDNKLYAYGNNKYALWDRVTKKPWGNIETETLADGTTRPVQKEFWVDTYSSDVWDYNVAIARELQSLGVDEIQFDYIRFPSDGPVDRIVNRYKVEGMTRLDALESFLQRARSQLDLPISVDIYGYNGYFNTDHLGQNMAMMSRYVDAVSAMLYPSHFWRNFLPKMDYIDRAKVIYQDGSDRTYWNTKGRVNVRPWVQAFLIGGELKMSDERIEQYLNAQLAGAQGSKASGWLLWNSSNRYYMVTKPLGRFATQTNPSASN